MAVDVRPPLELNRLDRARIEALAEALSERLEPILRTEPVSVFEAAPSQLGMPSEPAQQLINGPNGTGTSPSVYTVAGSSSLWPLSVMCRLTCSAVVASRSVALEYRDAGGTRYVVAGTQATVEASGQQSFCWHPQAGEVAWPIEDAALAPLPQQHLPWGYQLALKVWNGDAGDVIDQVRISARFDPVSPSS